MIPVIICGGTGTKIWPASRESSPKHFLPLFNGRSLFQINWEVLRAKYKPSEIYLQTNIKQAKLAKKQVREIRDQNIFIEPETRNQGPATGFTAAMLYKNHPHEPFMIIQADVLRMPGRKLLEMMDVCDTLARTTNKYITGGLKPKYAAMGVDYLIPGKLISKEKNIKVHEVKKFLWRGTKSQVEKYIKNHKALIHTNHSCITPTGLLEMFKKYRPEWHEPLMAIANGANPKKEYPKLPKGPIEEVTQLAHKNRETLIVELPFEWTDYGTWESLVSSSDKFQGLKSSDFINIDSKDNYVYAPKNKKVALVGVEGLIIVDTKDGLLICQKVKSSQVGKVVEILKAKGLHRWV